MTGEMWAMRNKVYEEEDLTRKKLLLSQIILSEWTKKRPGHAPISAKIGNVKVCQVSAARYYGVDCSVLNTLIKIVKIHGPY